ncbi:MAG: HlyD family efflux transporter periplasmic adaptor subunit [Hyphomicrobiales bacterium]|nr:HlyD family efflux transporter periplasmic adaptor subunit [Hyphomicrobiales bacterium]
MLTRTDRENNDSEEAAQANSGQTESSAIITQGTDLILEDSHQTERKKSVLSTIFRGFIQIILMGAILFGSFMAMNRLIDAKPEIKKRPGFRTVYTVKTVPVVLADYRPKFTVYGEAIASRTVDLRSLVSGEVIWVNPELKAGARVEKGDELVEIDDFQFSGALREAIANRAEMMARIKENESRIILEKSKLRRLGEQLELARSDHQRIAGLKSKGATTQKQLDDRAMILSQRAQAAEQSQNNLQTEKAKLEQQNAGLGRLNWRVELAERNLLNTMLKAPFDGIVRSTGVEAGRTVNANDIVVSLYEDAKIDIRFTLTDSRYGRLQNEKEGVLGRQLEAVWAIGNRKFVYPATVERIGADISSTRGGVEIFAALQQVEGNPAIRPGAFVEIYVPDVLFTNSAIVPESAIYQGNRIYLKQAGKLTVKTVQVLAYENGFAIIAGDIQNEERVLITRIAEISDGLRVREQGDNNLQDKNRKSAVKTSKDS